MVYVSDDPSLSNLLEPTTAIPATTNTMYMPALENRDWTYADNQTERPFYWFVRPCRAVGQCGPSPVGVAGSAQHTFFKKSPPVTGLVADLTQKTEVTFTWDNYWHDPDSTDAADKWGQTGEPLPQSAMKYRIEVATDQTFSPSSVIETAEVDQTTYTSATKIYANRTYWWRVQAVDSDENGLTWSTGDTTFVRESPPLALLSPVDNVMAPGTTAFRWQAQPYAKAYDIEVYKNDDLTFSSTNKVALTNATGLLTTAYTWSKALAPSASAYRWRVRRIDASGNPGSWSAAGRFFVTPGTPNITAPGQGAVQAPDGPVLEWEPLDGAASYTVTITPAAGGSAVTANTVSSAWAATAKFSSGNYTWTLTAKDATGNTLGTATSTFDVAAALTADQPPVILSAGGTGVGRTLTVQAPTWVGGHTDVTVTYQWLRDGQPIFGTAPSSGTGTSYVIQAADYGKTITVKATGNKPNYATGTAVSEGVQVSAGDALVATSPPAISGTPTVNSMLTAIPGTWSPTATSYTFRWLRNGAPIDGATYANYRPVLADVGALLTVEVTAVRSGYTPGVATSAPVAVTSTSTGGTGGTGGALTPTALPVISGTATVGSFLSTTNGTWSTSPFGYKYQWFRNGVPIAGATSMLYRLTGDDVSRSLTVTVTASRTGYADGSATSGAVNVAKVASTTSANTFPTILKPGQRAKLTITVTSPGISQPTGTIIIKDGRKKLAKLTLKAKKGGKVTVRLPRLKVGRHKIKVIYKGNALIKGSKSKVVKLTVRR
jgi:hypothetical protein